MAAAISALIKALEASMYEDPKTESKAQLLRITLTLLGYTKEPSWGSDYFVKRNQEGNVVASHNIYGSLYYGKALKMESLDATLRSATFSIDSLKK